jgi:hypothetical protein
MTNLNEYSIGLVFTKYPDNWKHIVPSLLVHQICKEIWEYRDRFNEILDKVFQRQIAAALKKIPDSKIVLIFDDLNNERLIRPIREELIKKQIYVQIVEPWHIDGKLFPQAWKIQKKISTSRNT